MWEVGGKVNIKRNNLIKTTHLRLRVIIGSLLQNLVVRTKFLEDLTSQSLCYAIHLEALNVANINYAHDYVKLCRFLRSHKTLPSDY